MHLVEAGCGAVLVLLALAWSRFGAGRRLQAESGAAKVLPGLALVLGVSLLVWGLTGG